jgi:acetolactate synthase-1/2/3 large subunit
VASEIQIPSEAPAVWEGGRLLAEVLVARGVGIIFSVSGGPINSIYQGAVAAGIRLIHTRHEAAAGFMADAVSRLGESIGVSAVTLGPGVANSLTPALTAQRASIPVLFLGGQAPPRSLWREPGMATDSISLMSPLTKWAARVPEVSQIPAYVDRAFTVMVQGRPGPVFLEVPVDVLSQTVVPVALIPTPPPPPLLAPDLIAAVDLLARSNRVVALIGDEAYRDRAGELLQQLVEQMLIPFAQLRLARGLIPETHALCLGPGYTPANPVLRRALAEADLVLLLGHELEFDLDYGEGLGPETRVMQIHPARERLHVNRPADVAVASPVGAAVKGLLEAGRAHPDREWVLGICEEWRTTWRHTRETASSDQVPLHPIRAIGEVTEAAGEDGIYVTSHGNIDFWADADLRLSLPGSYLRAGQSGALGAEVPYGVAASLAHPDRPVVVFVGDGGVGYHIAELDTAARYGAHPVVVVLDDEKWGAIALPQQRQYGSEVEMSLPSRDWPAVAKGLGALGFHAEKPSEITVAVRAAIDSSSPALVRIPVQSVESPYMRYITGG